MGLPDFGRFERAVLRRRTRIAEEQVLLEVEPPAGYAGTYCVPGQFCKLRANGIEGIYALYSSPDEWTTRFLIRVNAGNGSSGASHLAALDQGGALEMTLARGEGFDLERARGRRIYCLATGTGIAPIRAAVEYMLARTNEFGPLTIEYGLRSEEHNALPKDIRRWRARGVRVGVHFSSFTEQGQVTGTTVQDALAARSDDLSDSALLCAGQGAMIDSAKQVFGQLGGRAERFLVNH